MKIAMFFSGRITGYENCIENILKLKNKYDITFFCSLNCEKISKYKQKFLDKLNIGSDQYYFELVELEEWVLNLNKKQFTCNIPNMYSQFYNNYKCINLIKKYQEINDIKFDCVIKYRTDIFSSDELKLGNIEQNKIYIPNNFDFFGVNDQIAYSDFETMYKYCSLINNIKLYCVELDVACHPETLTLFNLKYNNIIIERFNYNYILHESRNNVEPVE